MNEASSGVSVLVLAAGSSERMGEKNKLLLPIEGEAMLSKVLYAATQSSASSVHVLTGFDRERILAEVEPHAVHEIYNAEFSTGQDMSLAVGLAALVPAKASVLVMLGDQPRISSPLLDKLITAHLADGSRRALIPVFAQRRGTPRILPFHLVKRAAEAQGSLSLRQLLSSPLEDVHLYEVDDAAVLHDIDTPDDYSRFIKQSI